MRTLTSLPTLRQSIAGLWLAGVLLAGSAPVWAADDDDPQAPTRTALLEAERERKTGEIVAPQRSALENALYKYDNGAGTPFVFRPWHGLAMAGGDFPAGAGTTAGVRFTHEVGATSASDPRRPNRLGFEGLVAHSTRGYARTSAAIGIRNVGGKPLDLNVRGQRYEFPQEDFFGLGQNSRKENRTNYLMEGTDVTADVQWRVTGTLSVTGGLGYLNPTIGSGTDSRYPSTEEVFDVTRLPGYLWQPDFLRSEAGIVYDWRDNPLHPHAGGRYSAQLSNFTDREDGTYDFRRLEMKAQQYVPLPNRYRLLALRAAAVITDTDRGHQVPFYYQPTLGGGEELRGFREFRFQDRNSLLLTAEYRWEAWWALDPTLFIDAGTVAGNWHDLAVRNMDVSYGFGFRFHSNRAFVARLDMAFSREGFIPLLRFEHVF